MPGLQGERGDPRRDPAPWAGVAARGSVAARHAASRRTGLLLSLVLAAGCTVAGTDAGARRRIEVRSTPIAIEAGTLPPALGFRGGLVLSSADGGFGGLSSLHVSDDGARFLAVSDEGRWVRGRLRHDDGLLAAVSDVELSPMLGLDGSPLVGKRGDAEGLAVRSEHGVEVEATVSFEREHRVWRYALDHEGLPGSPIAVAMPAAIAAAPANEGVESLALLADGSLLAVRERGDARDIEAWIVGGASSRALRVAASPPWAVTDARPLPDGDLLLLERRHDAVDGTAWRLRRVPGESLAAGSRLEGSVIAEILDPSIVDNMEGLAVRKGASGETLLYLVSDDNFQPGVQRTLLLLFELDQREP